MFKLILLLILSSILFLYFSIKAYEERYKDAILYFIDSSRMCFFGGITVGICLSLPYYYL
jgi:hypothetical protein